METQIIVFVDEGGFSPFEFWLNSFGDKLSIQRILTRIERLKEGNFGDHKALGSGVWELKFSFGGGLRIYFGFLDHSKILILLGGNKASQNKDVLDAKKYWKKYPKEKK